MASDGARAGFSAVGRLWRRLPLAAIVLLLMPAAAIAGVGEGYAAYDRGDYQVALRELVPSANAGHAGAQVLLGTMYHLGKGVPQDYVEAARWYRRAADQDDAAGQFMLGLMYVEGQGVSQNYPEAARWFRLSADQGDAPAQFKLGLMHVKGARARSRVRAAESPARGRRYAAMALPRGSRYPGRGLAEGAARCCAGAS